jgi:hypothetical protein
MNLLSSLLKYTADQIAALRAKDTSQDTTVSGINSRLTTAEGDIDSLEAQFTTVVSAVTTDTEVTNIRVGDDGVTYDTAGNAVRKQFADVKADYGEITSNLWKWGDFVEFTQAAVIDGISIPAGTYTLSAVIESNDTHNIASAAVFKCVTTGDVTVNLLRGERYYNTITLPNECYRISLYASNSWSASSGDTASWTDIMLQQGEVYNQYVARTTAVDKDYRTNKSNFAPIIKKYVDANPTTTFGAMDKAGNRNASVGYTAQTSCSFGDKLKISGFKWNDNFPLVIYRLNGSVSGWDTEHTSQDTYYNNIEITVPYNCDEIVVNGYDADHLPKIYKQASVDTKTYVDEAVSENFWKGKKIVWFGTSIPAGVVNAGDSGGNGAYPTRIGEMLGATVYNEAVGSSSARSGNFNYITEDDPMGWKGMWAINIFLSLSLSSAEKQALADDWATWSTKLRGVSAVDLSNLTYYKNTSWDVKLAKYLSGGSVGQCDLYVFDHGHNEDGLGDYSESFLCAEPSASNPTDRTYWTGAFAFLVKKILEDNPKARICIIGHYENDRKVGVVASQKALADKWKFPLCKTWEMIGLSQNEVTVGGTTKTITNWWFPDDLHPASDPTGKALQHYAQTLYPFIRDVR